MTREEFQQLLNTGVVVLDGATGTNLQQAGMPVGVCPEQWILENPEALLQLQRQFIFQQAHRFSMHQPLRAIALN